MKILITGAASGIGRATALLASRGKLIDTKPELFLVDRDAANLKEFADTLTGIRVETCVADLSDPEAPAQIIAQVQTSLGGLDALISNAGAIHMMKLQDLSLEEYDRIFSINTRAAFLLAKAAYPLLKESRGAIVVTASMSSEHPTPSLGAYSASKASVVMLVKQMALEWGPDGIRANCISPGPTLTGMTAKSYGDAAKRDKRAQDIPLRRIGLPEDLANAALFLISPSSSFISGVNLMVDGGLSTTMMVSPGSAANNMDNR
jgi:NAD(P)-dependent dehydrogenase (short-subunit alcohol dehydrogenase family)